MRVDLQQSLLEIRRVILELEAVETARNVVYRALNSGVSPLSVVDALSDGLMVVGNKYENGEYFLSELIMAGILATEISNLLKPLLKKSEVKPIGKVVIGTVRGDLHDIGKNIVATMFSSVGFEVVDLGIDVPAEKFVDAAKTENPDIIGLSCLLTTSMDEMKNVIGKLRGADLRRNVKIMVGGRPITQEFADGIGADAFSANAIKAARTAKMLMRVGAARE